ILDVLMPSMDGWSVLSKLKADPALADIPVIMLSFVEDKTLGFALGASDYLTKPIDRGRLIALLNRYRRELIALRVLIVEDNPDTRDMVRRTLEKEGAEVVEAENGRIALDRIATNPPSLILLDLMMPEMNGFEFIEELQRSTRWREIPVVVMTAKELTPE